MLPTGRWSRRRQYSPPFVHTPPGASSDAFPQFLPKGLDRGAEAGEVVAHKLQGPRRDNEVLARHGDGVGQRDEHMLPPRCQGLGSLHLVADDLPARSGFDDDVHDPSHIHPAVGQNLVADDIPVAGDTLRSQGFLCLERVLVADHDCVPSDAVDPGPGQDVPALTGEEPVAPKGQAEQRAVQAVEDDVLHLGGALPGKRDNGSPFEFGRPQEHAHCRCPFGRLFRRGRTERTPPDLRRCWTRIAPNAMRASTRTIATTQRYQPTSRSYGAASIRKTLGATSYQTGEGNVLSGCWWGGTIPRSPMRAQFPPPDPCGAEAHPGPR